MRHTPPMPTPTTERDEAPVRTRVVTWLGEFQDAWDRLVEAQPLPSPFLRSWWIEHAATGTPTVIVCTVGDELVGGAVFEVDRIGIGPLSVERVRSLGQGVLAPDHLDLIATREHHRAVARAVASWLQRRGQRVIDLDGLAADGTLAALLAPHETDRVAAPYADLSSGSDEYLAARPGKVRSTVSRSARRFERAGAHVELVDADDIGAALDDLARLHDHRWADGSPFLKGWERCRCALAAGAARGDVALYVLRDEHDDTVAVEVDLVLGGRVGFYQAGRRTDREWRGCGSVVRAHVIRSTAEAGALEYDLLRGDETYKDDWATDRREVVHCVMDKGPLAVLATRARARKHDRARPGRVDG